MQLSLMHSNVLNGVSRVDGGISMSRRWLQLLLRLRPSQESLRPTNMRHVPEHIWRRHSALLMSRRQDG